MFICSSLNLNPAKESSVASTGPLCMSWSAAWVGREGGRCPTIERSTSLDFLLHAAFFNHVHYMT